MTTNPHITPSRRPDPQYAAAIHLLEHIRRMRYITADGLQKEGMLKSMGAWSHHEQILGKIALDLFDPWCLKELGHTPPSWSEATAVLDGDNLRVVIEAMYIVRGTPPSYFAV